jgi:hypothetical protein
MRMNLSFSVKLSQVYVIQPGQPSSRTLEQQQHLGPVCVP